MKIVFYLVYKIAGWKVRNEVPEDAQRCVMIVAPHTSNWDFVFGVGAFYELDIPAHFAMKKEWFRFPIGLLIKSLGGIPIDRAKKKNDIEKKSMVEAMAGIFAQYAKIAMTVTPEGSRSSRSQWKTGFWYTAKLANVPICLGHLNYETKTAEILKSFIPNDFEEDMRTIMAFYKDKKGKKPQFALDERYS